MAFVVPAVSACALNGMCREASSVSMLIDGSPPLPADLDRDGEYLTSKTLVVFWSDCEDPQSGIGMLVC
jgi:hypothetical protein